jgi:hypothetical protein
MRARFKLLFGRALAVFLVTVPWFSWPTSSFADDALVLPKGIFRFTMDANNYLPVNTRYGPTGKVEDVAVDYNRQLNSNAFAALAPLDPFVPGLPSIGDSDVSFRYNFNILDLSLTYGITDRITAGIRVPYWWVKNKVKARVNSGPGSSANVGKNAAFACGSPLCPLFIPGTVPLTTDDVQNLLGPGLDVNNDGTKDIAGFGFKRIETWSHDGVADIEVGGRYQYLKTRDWRFAFTGGVRFPTGRTDDINNLVDYEFGTGAYALLFRLNNDFIVSNLWSAPTVDPQKATRAEKLESAEESSVIPETGDLVFNWTFRYDVLLPDNEKKRVTSNANNPITANKERVHRNLGDIAEFEVSGKYGLFIPGLTFSALYKYGYKMQDKVSGKKGFSYHSLEEETKRREKLYIVGLTYSTIPLYTQKKFFLPFNASVTYRNRFAGTNNYLRSQFINFGLQFFF